MGLANAFSRRSVSLCTLSARNISHRCRLSSVRFVLAPALLTSKTSVRAPREKRSRRNRTRRKNSARARTFRRQTWPPNAALSCAGHGANGSERFAHVSIHCCCSVLDAVPRAKQSFGGLFVFVFRISRSFRPRRRYDVFVFGLEIGPKRTAREQSLVKDSNTPPNQDRSSVGSNVLSPQTRA